MRAGSVAVLAALAVVALTVAAGAREIDRDFHRSFDVSKGFRLDLRHGDGDVTITPWEKDVIDVSVRYRADISRIGFGGDPDFDVEFKEGDDYVSVIGRVTPAGPSVMLVVNRYEYTYTISAPSYVVLDLEGDDGDVEVTGWRADIDCMIDDGDVTLHDVVNERTRVAFEDGDVTISSLTGELRLSGDDGDIDLTDCETTTTKIRLFDGDVTAARCSGEFSVDADDGDIVLDLMRSASVRARTEDGDVEIDLGVPEVSDVDVGTDDGSVTVTLAPGSKFSFLVTMDDGDVRVSVPERDEYEEDDHSVSGVVRGGGGHVRVRTEDGHVLIREAS